MNFTPEGRSFRTENGWIKSHSLPEDSDGIIYVQGDDRQYDDRLTYYNSGREAFFSSMLNAYNEKYK